MRSHARLTYTEAWQMISEGTVIFEEHKSVMDDVKELYNLYQAFKKDRRNRGGISVESEELHFVFNENMEIEGVKPLERNDAHKLINCLFLEKRQFYVTIAAFRLSLILTPRLKLLNHF